MVSSRFRRGFVVRTLRASYMRVEINPFLAVKNKWERLQMVSLAVRQRGQRRTHKVFTGYVQQFDIVLVRRRFKVGLLRSLADCGVPTTRKRKQLLPLSSKGEDEKAVTSK